VAHRALLHLHQDLVTGLEGLLDALLLLPLPLPLPATSPAYNTPFLASPKSTKAASMPGSTLRTLPR
jgi:hypothetical protein